MNVETQSVIEGLRLKIEAINNIDIIKEENVYYSELINKKEATKNFKGQVVGRHPDALLSNEIHAKVQGYVECLGRKNKEDLKEAEELLTFIEKQAKEIEELKKQKPRN